MADANEMPDVLRKALSLEGEWEADATLNLGGQVLNFKYRMSYRRLNHTPSLYMQEEGEIPGIGTLIGVNLIGYDPYGEKLHWFTVDNFGTTHDHICELLAEDHMQLIHASEKEGKRFREITDLFWRSADEVAARLVATLGGEVEEELEGTFVRSVGGSLAGRGAIAAA
jgi:hypothetical protein